MHVHLFDQRLLDLLQEVHAYHPHIIELCTWNAHNNEGGDDFYIQLCEVAAAIGLVVEGDFTDKDVYRLCEHITKQLVKSRTILVSPNN